MLNNKRPWSNLHIEKPMDHPEYQKFIDAYNDLKPLPKTTLNILALIYFKTARTHVVNCLKNIFYQDPEIKRFTVNQLDPILGELIRKGLVVRDEIYFQCPVYLADAVCRRLVETGEFEDIVRAIQWTMPLDVRNDRYYYHPDYEGLIREIRIETYRGEVEIVYDLLDAFEENFGHQRAPKQYPFVAAFSPATFDSEWSRKHLPPVLQAYIARDTIAYFQDHGLYPGPQVFRHFQILQVSLNEPAVCEEIRAFLAEQFLLAGRPDAAERMIAEDDGVHPLLIQGWAAFLQDRNADAITRFADALKRYKKTPANAKFSSGACQASSSFWPC